MSAEDSLSLEERQRDEVLPQGRVRDFGGGTMLRSVSRLCGEIVLDRYEVSVGDSVSVQWEIRNSNEDEPLPEPSDRDWIGLFRAG